MSGTGYLALALFIASLLALLLFARVRSRISGGRGRLQLPDALPEPAPQTEESDYRAWRLVRRALANQHSAGGPLFRLHFEPEDPATTWRPGAVARVYCGPPEEVFETGRRRLHLAGDYMIGSLPAEGAVELVVRLNHPAAAREGGERSRWLCEQLQTGQQVALALRDDPAFLSPPVETPLILIGNATGLAGLQAHIKARPAGTRNWLMFGDRNSAGDEMLASEINDWVASGHLERCDLVLPGEGTRQRHVTDQIDDAREALLDWVMAGAAIYVCGSVLMGNDVDGALAALLGDDVVNELAREGRYRRSLY